MHVLAEAPISPTCPSHSAMRYIGTQGNIYTAMKTGIHLHSPQSVPSTSSSLSLLARSPSIGEMAGARKTRSNHQATRSPASPSRSTAALASPPSGLHHSNYEARDRRGRFVRRCNVNAAAAAVAAPLRPELPPAEAATHDGEVIPGPVVAQHPSLEEPAVGFSCCTSTLFIIYASDDLVL